MEFEATQPAKNEAKCVQHSCGMHVHIHFAAIKSAGHVFLYLLLKLLDGAHFDLLTFVLKNRDINVKIY